MNAKQFAAQMKTDIEDIKSKGTAAIYCDNIIAYLNEVENSPEQELTPVDVERYKADLQNWIEANKYQHESNLELFRSVITSGQSAIKSSFLLNGGAAVALLAFIGHLAQFRPEKVSEFGACLMPFAFGVLASAVTSGSTYLSQWLYASPLAWARKAGFAINIICILLAIGSYLLFAYGLFAIYRLLVAYA